jgi:hypothetical protein
VKISARSYSIEFGKKLKISQFVATYKSIISKEIMTIRKFEAQLHFHPVGQGLYASGHLLSKIGGSSQPFFRWVYDCGTISSNTLVHNTTKLLSTTGTSAAKPRLNLVVVSHFDKDHISGLVNLLLHFHVDVLLIPYLAPWQRAAIVFGRGRYVSKRDRAFILDPIGTIAQMKGIQVGRVVWAAAGNQDSRSSNDNDNDPGSPDSPGNPEAREEPPILTIDEGDPGDEWQTWELSRDSLGGIGKVSMLRPGGRLYIRGIWEFVPYQDATVLRQPDASFLADASAKLAWLLKAPCEAFKGDVLKRLKELYEARFIGNKQRNIISLFMYAGSLNMAKRAHCGCAIPFSSNYLQVCFYRSFNTVNVIYTGDGYLETPNRLSNFFRYLGDKRTRQILAFQVMHHGAESNWHAGLAGKIRPMLSVFSSDPTRGKRPHPHKPVELDFAAFNPVQVDRVAGLSAAAVFYVR